MILGFGGIVLGLIGGLTRQLCQQEIQALKVYFDKLPDSFFSGLQALVTALVFFELLLLYGASQTSDVLLLYITVLLSLQMLSLMTVEQFMFHYIKLKHKPLVAKNFYYTVLLFSFAFGLITFFFLFWSREFVLTFFQGMNSTAYLSFRDLLVIGMIELAFYPAIYVMQKMLNAEGVIRSIYVINSIPSTFLGVTIFAMYFYEFDLALLAVTRLISVLFVFLILFYIAQKIHSLSSVPLRFSRRVYYLVKTSCKVKFGHNIHYFFFNFSIASLLATLPEGKASVFLYAFRLVSTLNFVVVGPQYIKMQKFLSYNVREKQYVEEYKIKFYESVLPLFLISIAVISVFILVVIMLGYKTVKGLDVDYFLYVFVIMGCWQLIVIFEMYSVTICSVYNDARYFTYINTLFVAVFMAIGYWVVSYVGALGIAMAAVVAQFISFNLYQRRARDLIGHVKK